MMHTVRQELHFDMIERVHFRIATTVYRCLHGMAPEYLSELFFSKTETIIKISTPVISAQSTDCSTCKAIHLWTSFLCCCWTYHLEQLRDPELSIDNFRRQLKTFLFAHYTEDNTVAH